MKRYEPNITGVLDWVDSAFATPGGFSSGRWFQMMWPWMLGVAFSGIMFELLKFVLLEVRRSVYNRNRNLKYANRNTRRKNQAWRTKFPSRGGHKVNFPPPGFADDLRKQWDKVHDSLEEMLKFGDMLIELEDYVDNSYIFNKEGDIVGRNRGIKGFLEDYCPDIVYTTAMHYRALALKAREISKDHVKLQKICTESTTIHELRESFDSHLGVVYRQLDHERYCPGHSDKDSNPQFTIFSMREQAHSTVKRLSRPQRQRFLASLQDLVKEISVS